MKREIDLPNKSLDMPRGPIISTQFQYFSNTRGTHFVIFRIS